MKKKYQIFISSTYTDLKEERQAVSNAILKIHQFPVGMEQFNAGNAKQWEAIKESIDTSDYYVLLIGKRYGSVVDTGESYTEKEYNYAVSQGVPVLCFIKSDEANYHGNDFEVDEEKQEKLKAFIEKVKGSHTVEWFDNSYELAAKLTAALHNEMDKNNRPGWIRGDIEDADVVEDEEDDWSQPVTEYEFSSPRFPSDGKHKEIGRNGSPIGEGEYKRGKLITGIEYDVLVHVEKGKLIYKPDCPEDPYDASEDFEYERLESYGWDLSFCTFGMSEDRIVYDGLDQYYVADFAVEKKTEQMINIRTLKEFLTEKDPEQLERLLELIEDRE